MKKLAFLLTIICFIYVSYNAHAKNEYQIEVSFLRDGEEVQKIEKVCLYGVHCSIKKKLRSYEKFSNADVKIESLRTKGKYEWYFKVDIKTTNPLGITSKTTRSLYTTEEKLIKDPLIYQSKDLGRIEIRILP